MEDALQELVVALAVDAEHLEGGPRMHRRVRVTERPLVRRQLTVRVLVPLPQQQQQLPLREVAVDVRERDAVERQVPRREPRVLPRVGHREHVEAVEVTPVLVAAVEAFRRRGRHRRIADEPPIDVEMEELLRPQHAGECLPEHSGFVFGRPVGRELLVERVSLGPALGDDLVGGLLLPTGARAERVAHLGRLTRSNCQAIASRHLRAEPIGVHRGRAVDHVVVDAVLRIRRSWHAPQA